jgi:hypothetical protein
MMIPSAPLSSRARALISQFDFFPTRVTLSVTFRLGLVMLRKRFIWTTIGTVFVHTLVLPPRACRLIAVM